MHPTELVLSPRLRKTAFEDRVFEQGIQSFTIYNHMTLPVAFSSNPDAYQHLCEHVQLWDVAAERQVEVVGPDALELVELITPRSIAACDVGQCVYAPLADQDGLVVNDPLILRLREDRFWISIADSDVLLWVKGIAYGRGFDVKVFEPDVSPLAVQGPKADDLMADLLDDSILWDAVWKAGEKYNIRIGAPNLIERLETGLKSYGSDMTLDDHVLECGFEQFLKLEKSAEYMARESVEQLRSSGVRRRLCHVMAAGDPLPGLRERWQIEAGGKMVGLASSCAWSPKYGANLMFAMLAIEVSKPGTPVTVMVNGAEVDAIVCDDRWNQGTQ